MTNRYSDWQEDLSKELLKSKIKRNLFFLGLRNEYSNDLEVLRAIVKVMGLKEFSKLCKIPSSNLSKYLSPGKDLKISTINKLLSPFGIKQANIYLNEAA